MEKAYIIDWGAGNGAVIESSFRQVFEESGVKLLDVDDEEDRASASYLVRPKRQGEQFLGILLICIGPDHVQEVYDLLDYKTLCVTYAAIEINKAASQDPKALRLRNTADCLAFAELVARKHSSDSPDVYLLLDQPSQLLRTKKNFLFHLLDMSEFEADGDVVKDICSRPAPDDFFARKPSIELLDQMRPSRWGSYSGRRFIYKNYQRMLEFIEFGKDARFALNELAAMLDPAYRSGIVQALLLCRRLVTWELEGAPFECTVLIANEDVYGDIHQAEDQLGVSGLSYAVKCKENIRAKDIDRVRDLVEIAQQEHMYVCFDLSTSRLGAILVSNQPVGFGSRLEVLSSVFGSKNGGVAIHVRESKIVEVYAKGSLQMRFDGFEWIHEPLRGICYEVSQHLGEKSEDADWILSVTNRIAFAVWKLLDARKSSILVLLHEDDHDQLKEDCLREIRDDIVLQGRDACLPIMSLSPPALAGLLQIDGAHFLDDQGQICRIAHQIELGNGWGGGGEGGEDEPPQGKVRAKLVGRGVGRIKARDLSKRLEKSTVLKVSASGKVYIFYRGELVVAANDL